MAYAIISQQDRSINQLGWCTIILLNQIRRSDGDEHVVVLLLSCGVVWSFRWVQMFQRNILSPSSGLAVFWIVMSCWLVGEYQLFGGTYCVQRFGGRYCVRLQSWKQYVSPKRWYLLTSLRGITTQKCSIMGRTTKLSPMLS